MTRSSRDVSVLVRQSSWRSPLVDRRNAWEGGDTRHDAPLNNRRYIWRWWSATRHLARAARTYRCSRQAAFTSKVCSTSRGTPSRVESPVGTWTAAAAAACVCQCDGRWECLVKPANCYRFIGTHGVHVPERKKDHRGRSSVTVDVVTRLRETEWTISDYGNTRRSPFAISLYVDVCVPNEHRAMKNWKWN